MSARSYVVGLPVVITVHDDGTVEYDVDTAEAGVALWDDQSGEDFDEDVIREDVARVEADHDRRFKLLAELAEISRRGDAV